MTRTPLSPSPPGHAGAEPDRKHSAYQAKHSYPGPIPSAGQAHTRCLSPVRAASRLRATAHRPEVLRCRPCPATGSRRCRCVVQPCGSASTSTPRLQQHQARPSPRSDHQTQRNAQLTRHRSSTYIPSTIEQPTSVCRHPRRVATPGGGTRRWAAAVPPGSSDVPLRKLDESPLYRRSQ
jgi:hypothetical protein